jgi:hypothetical protein
MFAALTDEILVYENGSLELKAPHFSSPFSYYCNYVLQYIIFGARCWWRSWLRHCATSQKVAGSIPEGVIGIFRLHNPSGRTMALGLTQPLTKMSTRNISWG